MALSDKDAKFLREHLAKRWSPNETALFTQTVAANSAVVETVLRGREVIRQDRAQGL